MSFSSLLVNTVSIERPSQTYIDGVPTESFTPISTGTKCNIQYTTSKGFQPSEGGDNVLEGWNAFFLYGVDVQMRDKLTDELGYVYIVQTSPHDVSGRQHHVEVQLEIQE